MALRITRAFRRDDFEEIMRPECFASLLPRPERIGLVDGATLAGAA